MKYDYNSRNVFRVDLLFYVYLFTPKCVYITWLQVPTETREGYQTPGTTGSLEPPTQCAGATKPHQIQRQTLLTIH